MEILRNLLATCTKFVTKLLGMAAETVLNEESPHQNMHAVDANIDWLQRRVAQAVMDFAAGRPVSFAQLDLVMLAISVVSTLVARRSQATQATVPTG